MCCKVCGGQMIGDGSSQVWHCEMVDNWRVWESAPDDDPIYCDYVPPITSFRGEHAYLSNFFELSMPLFYCGQRFRNVEAAYQGAKSGRADDLIRFTAYNGATAKREGRKLKLQRNWDNMKDSLMLTLLRAKFSPGFLRDLLVATGDAELIEGNTWGDRYWGAVYTNGQWVGDNVLGKLLMAVRLEITTDIRVPF